MRQSSLVRDERASAFGRRRSSQLEAELADAKLLQRISTALIQENEIAGLYKKIVDAAVEIMGSQFGTMQMLCPDDGTIGKLHLLAAAGFSPEAEKYWEWVYYDTGSSCAEVLRTGRRVVIPDYATCDFMQGEPTLQIFLEGGVLSAQSTPLFSRGGELLGMISTHWNYTHQPSERDLNLLDILARQAADLIERTQNAEKLRRSEERLRALATATNDAMYRVSPDWLELYPLRGGTLSSDTGGAIRNWMQVYVYAADHKIVMSAIEEAIQRKGVLQVEHRFLKANGSLGWISLRAVPILNTAGDIIEWFGAATDVSDVKNLMTGLEAKVAERTKELQRSNEDLQQFAHVANHDLKEPVRKIRTFGLRLKDDLNGKASESSQKYTAKILESAGRMATMIEGVLTYTSYDTIEQDVELLDLNTILADILGDLEVLIAEKDARILYDNLPEVEGVRVLMYQLFCNLINNSLKFSTEGQAPIIEVTASNVSVGDVAFVEIAITDNGIGFDPEYSEIIFNTFTRLHSKDKYDGAGLGLSLARKIVERHQGTIIAHGSEGEGTVFTIKLPAKQPARLA